MQQIAGKKESREKEKTKQRTMIHLALKPCNALHRFSAKLKQTEDAEREIKVFLLLVL